MNNIELNNRGKLILSKRFLTIKEEGNKMKMKEGELRKSLKIRSEEKKMKGAREKKRKDFTKKNLEKRMKI